MKRMNLSKETIKKAAESLGALAEENHKKMVDDGFSDEEAVIAQLGTIIKMMHDPDAENMVKFFAGDQLPKNTTTK